MSAETVALTVTSVGFAVRDGRATAAFTVTGGDIERVQGVGAPLVALHNVVAYTDNTVAELRTAPDAALTLTGGRLAITRVAPETTRLAVDAGEVLFDRVALDALAVTASVVRAASMAVAEINVTLGAHVEADALSLATLRVTGNCADAPAAEAVRVGSLVTGDDWLVAPDCPAQEVALIASPPPRTVEPPLGTALRCDRHVLVTAGQTPTPSCRPFGLARTCVLVGTDADDPAAYDTAAGTAEECPPTGNATWLVEVVVRSPGVTAGSLVADTVRFETAATHAVEKVIATTVVAAAPVTLQATAFNASLLVLDANVTLAAPARIVSVSGTSALVATAPLRLTNMYGGTAVFDMYGGTAVFADATVDGFFNPSRLVLAGGSLALAATSALYTNGTAIVVAPGGAPLVSAARLLVLRDYTLDVPSAGGCVVVAEVVAAPEYLARGQPAAGPALDTACDAQYLLTCAAGTAFVCPEQVCFLTDAARPLNASAAYNSSFCSYSVVALHNNGNMHSPMSVRAASEAHSVARLSDRPTTSRVIPAFASSAKATARSVRQLGCLVN